MSPTLRTPGEEALDRDIDEAQAAPCIYCGRPLGRGEWTYSMADKRGMHEQCQPRDVPRFLTPDDFDDAPDALKLDPTDARLRRLLATRNGKRLSSENYRGADRRRCGKCGGTGIRRDSKRTVLLCVCQMGDA
jgi:hypothetical protein